MPTQEPTSAQTVRRTARFARQGLRIIPAVVLLLIPFIMLQAPYRTVTRQHEARQTPRAAAVGGLAWLLLAIIAWGVV